MQIKDYIEHTLLKPTALASDMEQLAQEAVEYGLIDQVITNEVLSVKPSFMSRL